MISFVFRFVTKIKLLFAAKVIHGVYSKVLLVVRIIIKELIKELKWYIHSLFYPDLEQSHVDLRHEKNKEAKFEKLS